MLSKFTEAIKAYLVKYDETTADQFLTYVEDNAEAFSVMFADLVVEQDDYPWPKEVCEECEELESECTCEECEDCGNVVCTC